MAAVILAAGRSSRLGFPKALAPVGDRVALVRAVDLCRDVGLEPVVVVLGFDEGRIRDAVQGLHAEIAVNPQPARGQTSSLRVGLEVVEAGCPVCLLPVDHARIEPATLQQLMQVFHGRESGLEIVAPSDGRRRGHPVLVSAQVADELRGLRDDQPAHAVIRRDPDRIRHVIVDDPFILRDMDTPADLEEGP